MRNGNDSGIQVPPWIGVWEGEAPRLSVRDIDMEFRGRGDRGSSCTARIETRRRPRGSVRRLKRVATGRSLLARQVTAPRRRSSRG